MPFQKGNKLATKKDPAVENYVTPTLQKLIPRDALAVEMALEYVRSKGTIKVDVVEEIVKVADSFAVALGWAKPSKSAKEKASELLDGVEE